MLTLNRSEILQELENAVRDIQDFPKEGIVFKDITPVLSDPQLFEQCIDLMVEPYKNTKIDKIAIIDARGFIFGTAMAQKLNAGLAPLRKPGKLPYDSICESYDLEYGSNTLEAHVDAVAPGEKVIIVDDLLATGGTALAATKLIERLGGNVVSVDFFAQLEFLNGCKKLKGYAIRSLLNF